MNLIIFVLWKNRAGRGY